MSVLLRIDARLLARIHEDLSRPHPHAGERVAFLSCRPAALRGGAVALLGQELHRVLDEDYEHNDMVGAMLGSSAFRRILQYAYGNPVSILHVHRHDHRGRPWFSHVDLTEAQKYVPDFWKVRRGYPHGILVLSHDSAAGLIWISSTATQCRLSRITVVGAPTHEVHCNDR
jgi:hypothetical protein